MNVMILQERRKETNKELERYLHLQKGLNEQQTTYENLQSLFEVEELLKESEDEQLINTIYLQLTKQFHQFNSNIQYEIYSVFDRTAEEKYGRVINKKELLEMFQDHLRSLDQVTRTIAIKILGVLSPFYSDSIETFHFIIDILLNSEYQQEITSCVHLLGNFVQTSNTDEFALRLLTKGHEILRKCCKQLNNTHESLLDLHKNRKAGINLEETLKKVQAKKISDEGESIYLKLLNRVGLKHGIVQVNLYNQIIDMLVTSQSTHFRKKLKLLVRVCRLNYELAREFFAFCDKNFDQFGNDSPQILSHSQSVSTSQNFSEKLKNIGKSLNSMLEKKPKSPAMERAQAAIVEAIVLIFRWSKHFEVMPSHSLNEKILKGINKHSLIVVKEYIFANDHVNKSDYLLLSGADLTEGLANGKNILLSIDTLAQSSERRRCLNLLEMEDYDTRFVEKNFRCLQQVSVSLHSPNDITLLFKSFSNVLHKLSFQLLSKQKEQMHEFHAKHYAKLLCLIAFLAPLRSSTVYQSHIIQLLRERVFKIYLPLYRLAIQCSYSREIFSILNLILCLLFNKLSDKEEVRRFIHTSFLLEVSPHHSVYSQQERNLLKRIATQFASFNLFDSAYALLTLLQRDPSIQRVSFQIQLLKICMNTDKQLEEATLLELYDTLLFLSNQTTHPFDTLFLEFTANYYSFLLTISKNTNIINFKTLLDSLFTQISTLLSHKFNLDSASRSTLRFLRTILINIREMHQSIDSTISVVVNSFDPQFSRRNELRRHEEEEDESGDDDDDNDNILDEHQDDSSDAFVFDFFIDGRQNLVEKLLYKPTHFLEILKRYPLVLPRCLFIFKQQPHISIRIHPLFDYSLKAEKGLFLQGEISLLNLNKHLKKSKIKLSYTLKQDIQPSECIYKHVSTKSFLLEFKPSPKIFSQHQPTEIRYDGVSESIKIPYSILVLFPYIGSFSIILSAELLCRTSNTPLLTSFSQLISITAT